MPIHNQIFEAFRENERQIKKAINLLRKNKYVVYKDGEYINRNEKEKIK